MAVSIVVSGAQALRVDRAGGLGQQEVWVHRESRRVGWGGTGLEGWSSSRLGGEGKSKHGGGGEQELIQGRVPAQC